MFARFDHRHWLIFHYYKATATISCLFHACRPSAILRFIVSVVVNSIKCLVLWSRSHICQKIFKGIYPAFANSNPAPAIKRPCWNIWTIATAFHGLPDSIFRWNIFTLCESMSRRASARLFLVKTAATFGELAPERVHCYHCRISTIAKTLPPRMTSISADNSLYQQAAKLLSSNVMRFCHNA